MLQFKLNDLEQTPYLSVVGYTLSVVEESTGSARLTGRVAEVLR